ncbi:unnamed protein product, partial [marine sediment metagenome]
MAEKVKWRGEDFRKEIGGKCQRNMEKACLFLE